MSGSTLIEVSGDIVLIFTRGVKGHYNPEESENTAESFRYDPRRGVARTIQREGVSQYVTPSQGTHHIVMSRVL